MLPIIFCMSLLGVHPVTLHTLETSASSDFFFIHLQMLWIYFWPQIATRA